jgi:hypothetical protein
VFGCCVVNTLSSQVGIKELTGRNDGVEIDKYLISSGFKPNSRNPYCAAFLVWGWKQCGLKQFGNAYSPSWFPKNRIVVSKQKGWGNVKDSAVFVFGLYYNNLKRIAHVGYIEQVHTTYIITIEANSSQVAAIGSAEDRDAKDSGGVWRKRRMKKGIYQVSKW